MACSLKPTKPAAAAEPGDAPLSTEDVLRAEYAHVLGDRRWTDLPPLPLDRLRKDLHDKPDDQRPSALCLSGGGIRSATFCLGVLQWLAEKQQLKDFHYLSTVSGGGYIGSWLAHGLWQAASPAIRKADDEARARVAAAKLECDQAAATAARRRSRAALAAAKCAARAAARHAAAARAEWLHRVGQSAGSVDGASASGAARAHGSDPVAPLRALSNYLSPTGGLSGDAFSLAAIFIRNLLLNMLVWMSLLAAAVALPRLYIAMLNYEPAGEHHGWLLGAALVVSLLAVLVGVAFIVADLPAPRDAPPDPVAAKERRDRFDRCCFAPVILAALVLSIGGAWLATLRESSWWWFVLAGAGVHWLGVPAGMVWRRLRRLPMRRSNAAAWIGFGVVGVVGAVGGALTFIALSKLAADPAAVEPSGTQRLLYATFAVPAMTGAFWLAMALYAGLMGRFTDEQDREWWARATGAWLRFSLLWIVAFGLVVWLPLPLLDYLGEAAGPTAVQFGVGGGVLGGLTSLIGYWSKNGTDLQRKTKSVLRVLRVRLLDAMAALVVVATLLALSLTWSTALDRCHGWQWTAWACRADLHAQTDFLREQTRLRAEYQSANKGATDAAARNAALVDVVDDVTAAGGLSASAQAYRHVLLEADARMLLGAIALLLMLAALLALFMGVNVFSLHGMYGNRLVRAYLGSGRTNRRPHWFTGFDPDDNPPLAKLEAPLRVGGRPRLYPVINIALNIVKPRPDQLDWQQRKAAPFIATPLYCGADRVDFRPTHRYAGVDDGGMSLGRAMTISGAAASPNMGYHSSPPVTFVMALFNVRLGWWSPNPRASGTRWESDHCGMGLDMAWAEATGRTGVDDPFVYLSDGGHFDNLGIYEMVRRRCRRIVAVDATCDGSFKWSDLLDVVRKIRVDLGIPIELPPQLPGHEGETGDKRRFIEAKIRYSARDGNHKSRDGTLIVLKPRLLPESDPPELAAYAAASAPEGSAADDPKRFPHQSTADQFFDETQFESYRLLGYTTAAKTLGDQPAVATSAPRKLRRPGTAAVVAAVPAAAGTASAVAPATPRPVGTTADVADTAGVGYLIHQMGSGAALATALTIGGTLGIAGTVALAPTELKLSDVDRALLKDGMALRVDEALKSGVPLRVDGTALRVDPPVLRLSEDDLNKLRDGTKATVDASGLNEPARRLTAAATELDKAAKEVAKLKPPAPAASGITVALDPELKNALNNLQSSVDRIAPRRNVRGQ